MRPVEVSRYNLVPWLAIPRLAGIHLNATRFPANRNTFYFGTGLTILAYTGQKSALLVTGTHQSGF